MWDESKHVIATHPTARDYYVAIDYGTNNPTVFGLFGVLGDKCWMEREYYYDSSRSGRSKTDAEFSAALREWLGDVRPREIIVDPSALSFKTQLRRDGFAQVRDADNSVLDGIRTVATMLTGGRLTIHESCKETIKEFSGYVWDAKAQAKGEDKPLKQSDHGMDSLRYCAHTLFGRGMVKAVRSLY
jgi:phage terminase large subunit